MTEPKLLSEKELKAIREDLDQLAWWASQRDSRGHLHVERVFGHISAQDQRIAEMEASEAVRLAAVSESICVYCGEVILDATLDRLREHIHVCPVHPLAEAVARAERAEAERDQWREYAGELREALEQVESREGIYSRNKLTHAMNAIETMYDAAHEALALPTPDQKEE